MKQAKIETIIIFFILILYCVLSNLFFTQSGNTFIMIINPFFWITLAVVLRLYMKKFYITQKLKKEIWDYTLIAVLVYIILYLIFGLFVTFGKNPNSNTIKGFLINFWVTGSIIICKEYIRFLIINNVFEKQKKNVCIWTVIIFSILEITNIININEINGYYIFKLLIGNILPIISKNILFTYISYCKFYLPAILYELFIYAILWTSPILPNLNWFMIAIIDIVVPMLLFICIRYIKVKKEFARNRREKTEKEPTSVVVLIIFVVLGIWFAWGIFPIKPLAVATGSMEPNINIGDVVIIKKCTMNDIKVGDVIEYKKSGASIIHRVLEINQDNEGNYYIVAEGDNNETMDKKVLEEQITGKCLFKIKYLGYPAVWISNLRVGGNN